MQKDPDLEEGHGRITTPMGRRGKPIKNLRLIPAEKAFALARKFQGCLSTTISSGNNSHPIAAQL